MKEGLSIAGFACNVNGNEISYFGSSSKVYSCAANPKKPTKKLIKFVESLGFSCYIEKKYNGFWDKYFYHLKFY